MLVFSRKENESFVIGDGPTKVVLTVVQIERGKVRIGIQADKSIP
ncbi:MAG: carbon storage regulator, partial [Acidobacteriaceae bacterium]|nr:carbon storage regulator [Acidobacteriaceae bacterium]